MVSGSVPTLHFVEPGLKINGEEWINVMDEYIVPNRPNSAALMEPGRGVFADPRTTRRRTLPGWPVNATRKCCTAQSSFNRLALQSSSPSGFFFVERAQDTARSASSSCQSRRIAGTFDPRVSQNVDRQPLDVRRDGCCMGRQAEGLRGRQRRLFSSSTEQ